MASFLSLSNWLSSRLVLIGSIPVPKELGLFGWPKGLVDGGKLGPPGCVVEELGVEGKAGPGPAGVGAAPNGVAGCSGVLLPSDALIEEGKVLVAVLDGA